MKRQSLKPNWFIGFPIAATPWLSTLEPPPKDARLFVPEDVHVTLVFLGAVSEAAARAAWRKADPAALGLGPWTMTPSALAPFGDPRRPSAWSVEPTNRAGAVEAAIAKRDDLYQAAGVFVTARDRRPPRPHATLARPKRGASPEDHAALRDWAERQRVPQVPIPVERLALYTWATDRRERLFQVAAERPL